MAFLFCGDRSASDASARIAGGLRSKVVLVCVHDDSFIHNGIRAFEAEECKYSVEMCLARLVRGKVAQITNMMLWRVGSTVWCAGGVEMRASGSRIRSRAITLFVDVKTVFARRKASHRDNHAHAVFDFGESDGAFSRVALSWFQIGYGFFYNGAMAVVVVFAFHVCVALVRISVFRAASQRESSPDAQTRPFNVASCCHCRSFISIVSFLSVSGAHGRAVLLRHGS